MVTPSLALTRVSLTSWIFLVAFLSCTLKSSFSLLVISLVEVNQAILAWSLFVLSKSFSALSENAPISTISLLEKRQINCEESKEVKTFKMDLENRNLLCFQIRN